MGVIFSHLYLSLHPVLHLRSPPIPLLIARKCSIRSCFSWRYRERHHCDGNGTEGAGEVPSCQFSSGRELLRARQKVMRYCGDIEGRRACQIVTLSAVDELISHHFFVEPRLVVVASCEAARWDIAWRCRTQQPSEVEYLRTRTDN
ncbi:hypothetical protein ElyMa_004694000 [Elysia marginata]|uniref:Uncharacterized protein n=1 Tax=Elysia marginata TaxID=1093978 RepID=A0AAV4I775_9GAST|nr:hypothetical protein ElyMa_004694000 [Elysia marginata]